MLHQLFCLNVFHSELQISDNSTPDAAGRHGGASSEEEEGEERGGGLGRKERKRRRRKKRRRGEDRERSLSSSSSRPRMASPVWLWALAGSLAASALGSIS